MTNLDMRLNLRHGLLKCNAGCKTLSVCLFI